MLALVLGRFVPGRFVARSSFLDSRSWILVPGFSFLDSRSWILVPGVLVPGVRVLGVTIGGPGGFRLTRLLRVVAG